MKKTAQYEKSIANLTAFDGNCIDQKTFIALTGIKPDKTIAHDTEEYILSDELCDYRGYEHGTKGVRYYYHKDACIAYFTDRLYY